MRASASDPTRCLILACGNTLRSDDGVGPWLAGWAQERFADDPRIQIVSCHQWTPELAEDIAGAQSVIFIDCSVALPAGSIDLVSVEPAQTPTSGTHRLAAPELLALARDLFGAAPREALLLTVGAGSTDLGENFSEAVTAALPSASAYLEETVRRLFASGPPPPAH